MHVHAVAARSLPPSEAENLRAHLRQLMAVRGWKQQEAAAVLGVSQQALSSLLRGASAASFSFARAVARELAPLLRADALVLSLQNGVDNADTLARHIHHQMVVPAVVYVATAMPAPGVVAHHGRGDLVIGSRRVEAATKVSANGADNAAAGARGRRAEPGYVQGIAVLGACHLAGFQREILALVLQVVGAQLVDFLRLTDTGGVQTVATAMPDPGSRRHRAPGAAPRPSASPTRPSCSASRWPRAAPPRPRATS